MRLGIRRKLIGTLMLVGLFPLAISLVVILGGGAVIQLREIRGKYEDTAGRCAEQINDALLHEELEKLVLISRLDQTVDFVRAHNNGDHGAGATLPMATEQDNSMDKLWPAFKENDGPVAATLGNEQARRLAQLSEVDGHPRATQVTNRAGQTIAADAKTDDYFQGDETWWQQAFNEGKGRVYVSSITKATSARGGMQVGDPVVEISLPIYDKPGADGKREILGIMKDELSVAWLLKSLQNSAGALHALTQLVDKSSHKTVYAWGEDNLGPEGPGARRTEAFYFGHGDSEIHTRTMLTNNLVIGSASLDLPGHLKTYDGAMFLEATAPQWAVVVSKPSQEAMTAVYQVTAIVAGVGVALILVLFILGVAISNREIILPVMQLRQAAAAVGRGELNVRLLPGDGKDGHAGEGSAVTAGKGEKTFRRDELGDLAHDFDEMTRQLQRNVNQLARSNEAKRRFMELAGHELRTPVAYLLGVCQWAQKQLRVLAAESMEGGGGDHERTASPAARHAAAMSNAFMKIMAKTQRLNKIIDNLLKLVNNDQFATRMIKEPVDTRAMVMQVAADHRPFVAERKQQLVVDVADRLPTIEADRDKLEDALTNLMSNAIRFTPDGGTIRLSAHEIIGDMVEILVEDSGPGIPQEAAANLFEPFSATDDLMHHQSGEYEFGTKGLGLGLAIVRRFIELHGGIVRAHAVIKEGKVRGTQFQILLPVGRVEAVGGSGIEKTV